VRDVDRAAVWAHRHAKGEHADGDRGGHRIARRVEHRHGVGVEVRDVGVLRESLGAGETAKNKSRDREEPANTQFHRHRGEPGGNAYDCASHWSLLPVQIQIRKYRTFRRRCVSYFTLRITIILMETIKNLYLDSPARRAEADRPNIRYRPQLEVAFSLVSPRVDSHVCDPKDGSRLSPEHPWEVAPPPWVPWSKICQCLRVWAAYGAP